MDDNETPEPANPNQAAKYSSVELRREALNLAVSIHRVNNEPINTNSGNPVTKLANAFYKFLKDGTSE